MTRRRSLAVMLVAALAGCHGPLSVFDAASGDARRVHHLGTVLLVISAAVYLVVALVMLQAARRRRHEPLTVDLTPRSQQSIIWLGVIVPTLILTALFITSIAEMGASSPAGPGALVIRVTGHQWWWDVTYPGSAPVRTANEIHVPAGSAVRLELLAADVIHSFWVPRLQGKLDLIPGDTNRLDLDATVPGEYRGACAEYCGVQHAHMQFSVIADPPATFARWLDAQRLPATAPKDSAAATGMALVIAGPCATCHTIRGSAAAGIAGPDLTHVGSRRQLAAGAIGNDLGGLEGWISNAPAIKPGVAMPAFPQFSGDQLRAMATYLRGLR
jgi:cytochrome c oxidase subunit 2